MKFKEYFSLCKSLLKSKSLVILRCPYCDSFDITYYKGTLEEDNREVEGVGDFRGITYHISCNKCRGVCSVSEYWGK